MTKTPGVFVIGQRRRAFSSSPQTALPSPKEGRERRQCEERQGRHSGRIDRRAAALVGEVVRLVTRDAGSWRGGRQGHGRDGPRGRALQGGDRRHVIVVARRVGNGGID